MTEHISHFEKDGVIVIRCNHTKILWDDTCDDIANEVINLMDSQPDKDICFSFESVEFMSSAFLGKLVMFKKRTAASSRQIRLCKIRREIYEVFAITGLNHILDVLDDEDEAIASLLT